MAIWTDSLDLLACPACHGPLRVTQDKAGICCDACRLRFPVRDGIPVFLLDEAETIEGC